MKNITLSASAETIEEMRSLARQENKTFNDLFREWLEASVAKKRAAQRAKHLKAFQESIEKFSFKSDRKYTREEMNER